jgi:hypothetical protein
MCQGHETRGYRCNEKVTTQLRYNRDMHVYMPPGSRTDNQFGVWNKRPPVTSNSWRTERLRCMGVESYSACSDVEAAFNLTGSRNLRILYGKGVVMALRYPRVVQLARFLGGSSNG